MEYAVGLFLDEWQENEGGGIGCASDIDGTHGQKLAALAQQAIEKQAWRILTSVRGVRVGGEGGRRRPWSRNPLFVGGTKNWGAAGRRPTSKWGLLSDILNNVRNYFNYEARGKWTTASPLTSRED